MTKKEAATDEPRRLSLAISPIDTMTPEPRTIGRLKRSRPARSVKSGQLRLVTKSDGRCSGRHSFCEPQRAQGVKYVSQKLQLCLATNCASVTCDRPVGRMFCNK
jgi:hypothetical protein